MWPPVIGDGPTADDHPGSGSQLPADAFPERERAPALGAVLPEGRHARVEERPRVSGSLKEEDIVVLLRDVVAQRAVARRDEVGVRVNQPGKEGRVAVVHPLDGGPVRRVDVVPPSQARDTLAVEKQRRVLQGGPLRAVEQTSGAE
jgi:hypothetical protein